MPFSYSRDKNNGVLVKRGIGKLKLAEIFSSWDDMMNNYLSSDEENINGIILDYRDAEFDVNIGQNEEIVDIFKKHKEVLSRYKIAILTSRPDNIALPLIVSSKVEGYLYEIFSTEEAALEWLNEGRMESGFNNPI